ncbi:MAG: hypothetical protein OEM79_05070 [Nitrosopumilus sp.]|nr:hypothetical protein [Nitrosopumilus sp.]
MAPVIIIPLTIVGILGITGYLIYRFIIFDYLSTKSVKATLKKYQIKKTPFEIIKEYHEKKGKPISDQEISRLVKQYSQNEPEQFLAMYDVIRDKSSSE